MFVTLCTVATQSDFDSTTLETCTSYKLISAAASGEDASYLKSTLEILTQSGLLFNASFDITSARSSSLRRYSRHKQLLLTYRAKEDCSVFRGCSRKNNDESTHQCNNHSRH